MEAFLYQQDQPNFFLDPAAAYNYDINPSSPIEISLLPHHHQAAAGELSNASSCFTSYNSIPTSSLDAVPAPHQAEPQLSLDKKRKQSDGSCMSTGQSKGAKESKSRRKKPSGALKPKATKEVVKATKATNHEEPPSGYIHVRARRGQATDSHSLAERVRRERISERMKKLQGLVPGCDKVIGKALVLDEIINYVQSLQNQVEFLSLRLASVNPILYDFGEDFEDYMRQPEGMGSISQTLPSVIQNSHIPPTAFDGSATNILQQVIGPASPFPLHGQGPSPPTTTTFSQWQFSNASGAQQHVLFPVEEKHLQAAAL